MESNNHHRLNFWEKIIQKSTVLYKWARVMPFLFEVFQNTAVQWQFLYSLKQNLWGNNARQLSKGSILESSILTDLSAFCTTLLRQLKFMNSFIFQNWNFKNKERNPKKSEGPHRCCSNHGKPSVMAGVTCIPTRAFQHSITKQPRLDTDSTLLFSIHCSVHTLVSFLNIKQEVN